MSISRKADLVGLSPRALPFGMGDLPVRLGIWGAVELGGDDGGHAVGVERADRDGSGCHAFAPRAIQILEQPKHANACPAALCGMGLVREDADTQLLGVGGDLDAPAAELVGSPLSVTTMGARRVIGVALREKDVLLSRPDRIIL